MAAGTPRTIYLNDYRPPACRIETVELHFELGEEATLVRSRLACVINDEKRAAEPLVLDGRDLTLRSLALDGRALTADQFRLEPESLTIFEVPTAFTLEIETEIRPQENTSLEGLYRSSGNFCTQCEAEGFRKMTYFQDRPDVMATYTTTIAADRDHCPVLLANGNLLETGVLPENRHFARWHDPFPKPSYLFALVAGDLACIEDEFVTCSGRTVTLQIYVEHHNRDKCGHAMRSLKKAMGWDEEVFGLEYDLDRYMIVAVDDFNMGAMENKGLNVFNSKYVLAGPETATDGDYAGIEAVIGHEYFHNWTGNRITCRDWFQLSLKEGLTVFRDQEFSADAASRPVQRISDVRTLRNRQFSEDAGPMAHAVRPEAYIEINNFYTMTVYEKGAEVIRMIRTLLGSQGFRRGMDLYRERHDGQAVTTDDFVRAMEDATGADLGQFRLWYSQAGTPTLEAAGVYDAGARSYTLTVEQKCPPTPGQPHKQPLHIPLAMGLLDKDGRELPVQLEGEPEPLPDKTRVLDVRREKEVFRFVNVPQEPVPSLLRRFSAPVKLHFAYADEELEFLLANDRDLFNRWEAGQCLAGRIMLRLIDDWGQSGELHPPREFVARFQAILRDDALIDKAFVAQVLTLPSEEYLAGMMAVIDVEAIHGVRQFLRRTLAENLHQDFLDAYRANADAGPYRYDTVDAGRRQLKNLCLSYLMMLGDAEVEGLCLRQFEEADNMTDALSALRNLAHRDSPAKEKALAAFDRRWRDDPLVMDKWFGIQATAPVPKTLDTVRQLMRHPAFAITNPNRVRALIGAFAGANPVCFHAADGAGYRFLADQVLCLDPLNPQIAARLLANLSRWRHYDRARQSLMQHELKRVLATASLSRDVYEIASKSLG